MVKQTFIKSRKVYQLTFEVAPAELPQGAVKSLVVAGTFNGWSHTAAPFKKLKSGVYKAIVEVDQPGMHQYRYLLNGETWLNDWHAEAYAPGEQGADNCVVTVRG